MRVKRFNESFEDENNIFFVYCFLDNRKPGEYIYGDIKFDYEPIYVGKGKGNRAKNHLTIYKNQNRNNRFYNKLGSIIKSGATPTFINIKESLSEKDAFEYERFFIKLIGRIENGGTLTNLSDGGEGQSGFRFSEETKEKMSKTKLGKKLGPMSDEAKLNISLSKIGKISPIKGKKLEDIVGEDRAKEIKAKMSKNGPDKYGEKNPMFGKKHSEESVRKMKENTIKLFGEDNPSYGRERKESEKVYDTWQLTNDKGEIIEVDNLSKFCRENGLNPSCMRDLSYGTAKRHKNWIKVVKLTDNVKKKKSN